MMLLMYQQTRDPKYGNKHPMAADLEALLREAKTNPIPRIAADSLAGRVDALRGRAETALKLQNDSGAPISDITGGDRRLQRKAT